MTTSRRVDDHHDIWSNKLHPLLHDSFSLASSTISIFLIASVVIVKSEADGTSIRDADVGVDVGLYSSYSLLYSDHGSEEESEAWYFEARRNDQT